MAYRDAWTSLKSGHWVLLCCLESLCIINQWQNYNLSSSSEVEVVSMFPKSRCRHGLGGEQDDALSIRILS